MSKAGRAGPRGSTSTGLPKAKYSTPAARSSPTITAPNVSQRRRCEKIPAIWARWGCPVRLASLAMEISPYLHSPFQQARPPTGAAGRPRLSCANGLAQRLVPGVDLRFVAVAFPRCALADRHRQLQDASVRRHQPHRDGLPHLKVAGEA